MNKGQEIKAFFNKGIITLDSNGTPLPESLDAYPRINKDSCEFYFITSASFKGNLKKNILNSFTDMKNFINLYIEYLEGI